VPVPSIVTIVVPSFATIAVGFFYGRWRRRDISAVVDLAMFVALPALAFTNMLEQPIVLSDALKIWGAAVFIVAGGFLLAFVAFRLARQRHSGLYLPVAFMNAVNIPFPIILMAYGTSGLATATLFSIPNAILVYTLGVHIASRSSSWRDSLGEIAGTPLVYAALIGLALNLLRVQPPALLVDSLKFIGAAAIPLVLIVLGVNLSAIRLHQLSSAVLASILRLGGGLALGVLAVALFNLQGVTRQVVIFDSAMPAAVFTSMVCAKYDNESEMVSSVVFVTTVASLVTVPLLLYLLG
jgi:malate permease and related proteins